MKMYTIYDKKMGTHIPPMFVDNIVQIQRDLQNLLKNPESKFAQFPSDYEIYYLGTYDYKTSTFDLTDKPVFEMNISELLEAN